MSRSLFRLVVLTALLLAPSKLFAAPITIDFESLTDLDSVTTQYAGLTFTNATVLTAGISLNEIDFPPHSGTNVVFDDGGSMSIVFSSEINSVSGFFTYSSALTLLAYDSAHNLLGTVLSASGSNFGSSSANELLSFSSQTAIASIVISGDAAGGSFVLDDLRYDTVPEPSTLGLLGVGVLAAGWFRKRRK